MTLSAEKRREWERLRHRRKRPVRAQTENMARASKKRLLLLRDLLPESQHRQLPATRGECEQGERPCPYVTCRWNLYLDVHPRTGNIRRNFPDLEPNEMRESCVLDVADRGGETLERMGEILNLTRERVRQISETAMARASVQLCRGEP